jgi:integrase
VKKLFSSSSVDCIGGEEASRECPECHSKKNWKAGVRQTPNGEIQRFLCRDCGFRFSEKSNIELQVNDIRQLCAISEEAKKLDTATEIKTVAGEIGKKQQDVKGKIVQYALALRNKGRTAETIRTYVGALYTLMNKGAVLTNPSEVEEVIAKQEHWSLRSKRNYTAWYSRFARFLNLDWEKPDYKAPNKTPFFPLESEIDQIIVGSPRKTSIALQIAKETAARIGEIVRLKWTDINFQTNTISINEPEKGSNTGIYKVSSKLIIRIQVLPRTSERIFGKASTDSLANMLLTAKKKLASNQCNPRLLKIHFHTLRHWSITNYAYKVKDAFKVQIFARHKDLKCTSRYIHYAEILYQSNENDDWIIKAVKTVDEAIKLGKVGFVPYMTIEGVQLVRKRK